VSALQDLCADLIGLSSNIGSLADHLGQRGRRLQFAASNLRAAMSADATTSSFGRQAISRIEAAANHCIEAANLLEAANRQGAEFAKRTSQGTGSGVTRSSSPAGVMTSNSSSELDERLRCHLENSRATPAGRAFYEPHDEEMFAAAAAVPADPGYYTLDMHADFDHAEIGSDHLDAADIVALLRADPGYHGGPVRLFACNAGQTDDGLSSQVASILDQEVKGPTEAAWSDGTGRTWVTSVAGVDIDGDLIPTYPCDGSWRTFAPTTERER
jgi:hypothetical protein